METSLRVLIVGDSDEDLTLLVRELRNGGYGDPIYRRVDTQASMNAALDSQAWDLIIADYALAQFSGLAALSLLKSRSLDLPVIMISGKLGEEGLGHVSPDAKIHHGGDVLVDLLLRPPGPRSNEVEDCA